MKTSKEGISLIKRHEGLVLHVYQDAAGYPTIGYGHLIKPNENFTTITEEEAEKLLLQDLLHAERSVIRNINAPITRYQFDALVSFTFNLGTGALQRSTLRRKLNRQEYKCVPNEFLRWVYAGGRKLRGLRRRRQEEAELFAEGTAKMSRRKFIAIAKY